jgi:signal transduction histidine kinase
MVAVAVLVGLLALRYRVQNPGLAPTWLLSLDFAMGALACVALFWRKRFPVALTAVLVAVSVFAESVAGAMMVALFTVAVHRPARIAVTFLLATVLAFGGFTVLRPEPDLSAYWVLSLGVAGYVLSVAWGLVVRSRRELVASLRDRAEGAEVEARLRAERAQHEARETLAREMHDVLGHRLSLLSVHAGALVYHRTATREEITQVAEVIRENAHGALQDLREVIGVLRAPAAVDPDTGAESGVRELPLPGAGDIAALVEETRGAGTPVALRDEIDGELPATAGRTLYRFVQECLTNVRKHAPGAATEVLIEGGPDDGVVAEVRNAAPARTPAGAPGSGEGLRGLAERAALVGGGIEHGPTESGGFRVGMWLPWTARSR